MKEFNFFITQDLVAYDWWVRDAVTKQTIRQATPQERDLWEAYVKLSAKYEDLLKLAEFSGVANP